MEREIRGKKDYMESEQHATKKGGSTKKSEEIKKYTETNDKKKKHNHTNSRGCSKSSPIKEVHGDTSLPLKTRKSQIDNLTCHLKELDKE